VEPTARQAYVIYEAVSQILKSLSDEARSVIAIEMEHNGDIKAVVDIPGYPSVTLVRRETKAKSSTVITNHAAFNAYMERNGYGEFKPYDIDYVFAIKDGFYIDKYTGETVDFITEKVTPRGFGDPYISSGKQELISAVRKNLTSKNAFGLLGAGDE